MIFSNKQKNNMESIFNADSIAIVGASQEKGKVGTAIAENLSKLGYKGKVYFVNPTRKEIHGKKCYESLYEIKENIDVAIVVIPSKFVYGVIEKASDKVKNFVIISAGFSEIGGEGTQREKDLRELAEKKKLLILGPNCLGFINPYKKINASFAVGMPEKGNIAFVSQSGALMVAAMDIAKKEGLKFSSLVSIGNKMQLSEVELLQELGKDQNTKVIGMYLEGIKDGKKFIEVASEVSRMKPIVILKAGKTEKSQKAISSHTGALSGSDEIMDAVFEKTGIIRANNLQDFFEILEIISSIDAPSNENVAVITNAGGAGVLVSDSFMNKKLKLLEFSDEQKKSLRAKLPEECSVENPIDVIGDAAEDRYEHSLLNVGRSEAGTVMCILTPQEKTPVEKIAKSIVKFSKSADKVVVAAFIGGDLVEEAIMIMKKAGIGTFNFPERAIEILDHYYRWSKWKKSQKTNENESKSKERREIAQKLIEESKSKGKKAMRFDDASNILALYGLNSIESYYFRKNQPVGDDISYPVVAKIDSDKILHKTDQKALILNIKNKENLEESLSDLYSRFPDEDVLVQPMLEKGAEVILGVNRDEIFGPVILCGLGGIYAEVFKMVDFYIAPMSHDDIVKKLLNSKVAFLFLGARGQDKYDVNELAGIILGVLEFASDLDEVMEFDINPLFIYNNGNKATAVDLKIIF